MSLSKWAMVFLVIFALMILVVPYVVRRKAETP
jgi:hypothetical protein